MISRVAPASRLNGMIMPAGHMWSRPTCCSVFCDALGLPCDTRSDLLDSRRQLGRRTGVATLPPLITAIAGRPTRLDVGANEPRPARLILESGGTRDISLSPVRGRLRLPGDHGDRLSSPADRGSRNRAWRLRPADATRSMMWYRMRGFGASRHRSMHCAGTGDGGIGDAAGIAALAEAAGSGRRRRTGTESAACVVRRGSGAVRTILAVHAAVPQSAACVARRWCSATIASPRSSPKQDSARFCATGGSRR